jgi:hypothetical protein
MLIEFIEYLTFENIYLWTNFAILPFWLMLAFIPNSKLTIFFINSIILPLILSTAYIFVVYQIFQLDEPFYNLFYLYLSLDNLSALFSSKSFLLIFWIHFVAINIFLGSWVSRDAIKYNISKRAVFTPLILIYFMGPVGLVYYWFIRIFYAKKIMFHD